MLFILNYVSNQLESTLGSLLGKALHVGERSVVLQRPICELTGAIATHITTIGILTNGTVGSLPKPSGEQDIYLLVQGHSGTGQL